MALVALTAACGSSGDSGGKVQHAATHRAAAPARSSAAPPTTEMTSAQICARVPLAALSRLTGDRWTSGKPKSGYPGCEITAADGGSAYVQVDQTAVKIPDPARAAAFASTFFAADTSASEWKVLPGLGDEAKFAALTGSLAVRKGPSVYKVQLLSHTLAKPRVLAADKTVVGWLSR